MYDIITFGSATKDIFINTKEAKLIRDKKFVTGKGICLNLGSKVEIEDIVLSSGGGGTNTAVTFANQGFKTAYCGSVGKDFAGEEIIAELGKFGVSTELIVKTDKKPTNHSVVLSGEKEDRTILVYRGASTYLTKENIPWNKLQAKWFYISPLSGELCQIFNDLIDFAVENKIKIALNPGSCQLSLPDKVLRKALNKVDVLILNQEEASELTKIPFSKEEDIFRKIDEICPGIAIMTKGDKGAVISDGQYLYRAASPAIKVVDTTGAGDSFGAGFVSGYIQSGYDVTPAMQLGIANAIACLKSVGAKDGLLKKDDKFAKVKVIKEECQINGLCQCRVCK